MPRAPGRSHREAAGPNPNPNRNRNPNLNPNPNSNPSPSPSPNPSPNPNPNPDQAADLLDYDLIVAVDFTVLGQVRGLAREAAVQARRGAGEMAAREVTSLAPSP